MKQNSYQIVAALGLITLGATGCLNSNKNDAKLSPAHLASNYSGSNTSPKPTASSVPSSADRIISIKYTVTGGFGLPNPSNLYTSGFEVLFKDDGTGQVFMLGTNADQGRCIAAGLQAPDCLCQNLNTTSAFITSQLASLANAIQTEDIVDQSDSAMCYVADAPEVTYEIHYASGKDIVAYKEMGPSCASHHEGKQIKGETDVVFNAAIMGEFNQYTGIGSCVGAPDMPSYVSISSHR